MVAHKFDFTGWDIEQVIGVQASGKHRGSFVVKYESDSRRYLHQLNIEDYGASKIWVALAKKRNGESLSPQEREEDEKQSNERKRKN
jgi:hypothetical protein